MIVQMLAPPLCRRRTVGLAKRRLRAESLKTVGYKVRDQIWLRRQDAALPLYQRSQQGYFFGRLRLCAACTCAPALEGPRASR